LKEKTATCSTVCRGKTFTTMRAESELVIMCMQTQSCRSASGLLH